MATVTLPQITFKRHREDPFDFHDCYSADYEDSQNPQKRLCHGILSEFLCTDDGEALDTVQDELVLNVMKILEEEISQSSVTSTVAGCNSVDKNRSSTDKDCAGEVEESFNSTGSYEYLVHASDDELGIPQRDDFKFSQEFWGDIFENSLTESSEVNLLRPWLSHCYSYNDRNYTDYSDLAVSDPEQHQWVEEALAGADCALM